MNWQGWAEIALTLALIIGLGWPLGPYLARIWKVEPDPSAPNLISTEPGVGYRWLG